MQLCVVNMQNEYQLLVYRLQQKSSRNTPYYSRTAKRRVLNPSTLGFNWGKTINSESNAFLDEVMVRIRSYLEGKGNVTDFISQSSLRKTSDLSLPLEGLGLENALSDIDNFLKHSVKTNQPVS